MNISSLLIKTSLIFYILAVVCFCAFCVILLWYLVSEKKNKNNVQTKSWTIESAKKFLESNNINIKESSNEKVVEAKKSEIIGKTDSSEKPKKVQVASAPVKKAPAKKENTKVAPKTNSKSEKQD